MIHTLSWLLLTHELNVVEIVGAGKMMSSDSEQGKATIDRRKATETVSRVLSCLPTCSHRVCQLDCQTQSQWARRGGEEDGSGQAGRGKGRTAGKFPCQGRSPSCISRHPLETGGEARRVASRRVKCCPGTFSSFALSTLLSRPKWQREEF